MTPFWKCLKSPIPKLEIRLHSQGTGSYESYTTGDIIEGSIHVISETDLALDSLSVTLQGRSEVEIEQLMHYSRSKSKHNFIKISHLMNESNGRLPRSLHTGKAYSFPFLFEVPKRIPSSSCQHTKKSLDVSDAHRQLPPTLERSEYGQSDVFASNVAKISYAIYASLFAAVGQEYPRKPLASAIQPIRIFPSYIEDTQRQGLGSQFYCTHNEKKLRSGHLGPLQGKLIAFASSPKPIEIGRDGLGEQGKINTTIDLGIHFYPKDNESPPQLCSVTTSLCSMTFYSADPWEDYPDSMIGSSSFAHTGQGMYCKSMLLSKRCVKSVPFVRQQPVTGKEDTTFIETPLSHAGFEPRYEASVLVPITLPAEKHITPTFHSCLISRVYFLDINLAYIQSRPQLIPSNVSLRVPVLISS